MAASQPNSLLLPQKKASLPPPPHSEPSFLAPPSRSPVPIILAHPLPLFLSQFQLCNSENYPLSGYFLPSQGGELTDSGIWRPLWSAMPRVAVSGTYRNTNVGWGAIYTFFGNDLLDPSTTSCRSEPWIVCCQWKVCDYTKMWKRAKELSQRCFILFHLDSLYLLTQAVESQINSSRQLTSFENLRWYLKG